MASNTQLISEAFSGHRFPETYEHLADGVRWELDGELVIEGKDAVVAACESSTAEMAKLTSVEFSHFESVAGDRFAVVDAEARYEEPDGSVSVVSSADVYEFDGEGQVTSITSYAVELSA
jgi:hypothetical protein